MQQWLEAYACGLQHIREAADGRQWRPEGEGFAPKVSPLVEAFIGETGTWDIEGCAVDCWSKLPENVSHQRDEGACVDEISYLNELATCQPSRKAWAELVWPPVSSVPSMLCQAEHFGYIQGWIVQLGPMMPPCWFHMSGENGGFICFAQGMIFDRHVLVYNQSTNKAE